jgi:MFS family permease
VIVTWLVSLGIAALPVVVPVEVHGAVNMLLAGAIAGVVAYVASRMRFSQWERDGEVTGAKKLLTLAIVLLGATTLGCAYAHGPQGTTIAFGDAIAKSTARTCSADGGTISDNARLMIAQAVAAGVKAFVGGGVPTLPDLSPDPDPAVADPVVVVPEP